MPPKPKERQFVLVRWLDDETVSVMPLSAVCKDDRAYVGAVVKVRWNGRKLYDAEIMKISDDARGLNKLCDSIVNFEISRDDLLKQDEKEVDSTTEEKYSPAKKTKLQQMATTSKATQQKKKKLDMAKVEAAKSRAKEIFNQMAPISVEPTVECSSDEESAAELEKTVQDQQKLIERMRKQLLQRQKTESVIFSKNVVSNSTFDALHKNTICVDIPSGKESFDGIGGKFCKETKIPLHEVESCISSCSPRCHKTQKPLHEVASCSSSSSPSLHKTLKPLREVESCFSSSSPSHHKTHKPLREVESCFSSSSPSHHKTLKPLREVESCFSSSSPSHNKTLKVEPAKFELVPGYGIMIGQRQLDEAEGESNGSPTRLIRNLISVFFSREQLVRSSCYGSRHNAALDKDIMLACIKYVQKKYSVAKTALVDAINDKCANCRRKQPRHSS